MMAAEQSNLSPQDLQQLQTAFLNAFSQWETLEQMLRLQMGLKLGDLVAKGPMFNVVFDLLFNVMEPRGKLPKLIENACRHVPGNQQLWNVATRLGWAPDATDKPGEAAASFHTSLRALGELLHDPNVKSHLQAFDVVFAGADRRIHTVGDYKDIHDRLHDVQLLCYSPILSAYRDFPQGQTIVQIRLHARKLKTFVNQLRAIVQRKTLDANDFPWIEESLEVARLKIDEAVDGLSSGKLERALNMLARALELHPTIINSLLLQSVKNLNLQELHLKLQQVAQTIQTLGVNPNQLALFEKGVCDLSILDEELRLQMSSHRAWQAVDTNLRLVEGSLNQPIEDLEAAWRILQLKLAIVLEKPTDDWAEEIKDLAQQLDEAIKARNYSSIFFCFSSLQTIASDRFYNIDKDMKELCEKLRPLGNQFDVILRVME
jgi:hypothetical protein